MPRKRKPTTARLFLFFISENPGCRRAVATENLGGKIRKLLPPRNITHASPRLLQIAANGRLMECCEVLTRFGFRRIMLYLCTSKEERALNKRVFSSFFGQKNGVFTSEVKNFTLLRNFFLGVCGIFLRNVGFFCRCRAAER